jgi:hypothetical protein
MITAKNPCEEETSELVIDATTSPLVARSSSSITDTYRVGVLPGYPGALGIDVTFNSIGDIVITLNYQSVENKAYEGRLQVAAAGLDAAADEIFSAKFEVFGTLVYHKTSQTGLTNGGLSDLLSTDFGLFNFGSSNSVTLTISLDFHGVNTANLINFDINLGIMEHENVLDINGNCVNACANAAGKSVGIDFSQIPPTCLQCDTNILNQQFNPYSGEC